MQQASSNDQSSRQTGGVGENPRRGVLGDPTTPYIMQGPDRNATRARLLEGFRYWESPLRKRRLMRVRINGEVVGENVEPMTPVQAMIMEFLALRAGGVWADVVRAVEAARYENDPYRISEHLVRPMPGEVAL